MMRKSRYTCIESALMMTARSRSARSNAKADLPLAVGPAMRMICDTCSTHFVLAAARIARHVLRGNAYLASGSPRRQRGIGGKSCAGAATKPARQQVGLQGRDGHI